MTEQLLLELEQVLVAAQAKIVSLEAQLKSRVCAVCQDPSERDFITSSIKLFCGCTISPVCCGCFNAFELSSDYVCATCGGGKHRLNECGFCGSTNGPFDNCDECQECNDNVIRCDNCSPDKCKVCRTNPLCKACERPEIPTNTTYRNVSCGHTVIICNECAPYPKRYRDLKCDYCK